MARQSLCFQDLYAFKIKDAEPVIIKEMKQMLDKKVLHGKHMTDLTATERSAVIRSSMFLKNKYLASRAFEKFKARLEGGVDCQDKSLYENLSSPTAATTSVFTIAAIAASENGFVETTTSLNVNVQIAVNTSSTSLISNVLSNVIYTHDEDTLS